MPMPRTSGRDPFAPDRNPASEGPDADPWPFDPAFVPQPANDQSPAPADDELEPPRDGTAPSVGKQGAFTTARQWGAISREAGQALTHVSGSGRTTAGPVNPATGERWDYEGLSLADLREVRDRTTGLSERWERHALGLPAEEAPPERGLFAPDLSALHRVVDDEDRSVGKPAWIAPALRVALVLAKILRRTKDEQKPQPAGPTVPMDSPPTMPHQPGTLPAPPPPPIPPMPANDQPKWHGPPPQSTPTPLQPLPGFDPSLPSDHPAAAPLPGFPAAPPFNPGQATVISTANPDPRAMRQFVEAFGREMAVSITTAAMSNAHGTLGKPAVRQFNETIERVCIDMAKEQFKDAMQVGRIAPELPPTSDGSERAEARFPAPGRQWGNPRGVRKPDGAFFIGNKWFVFNTTDTLADGVTPNGREARAMIDLAINARDYASREHKITDVYDMAIPKLRDFDPDDKESVRRVEQSARAICEELISKGFGKGWYKPTRQ